MDHPQNGTTAVPAIQLRGIEFAYPDGTMALKGVDLSVEQGERVALLGPNGAGKSTLILHVNGIVRASRGSVAIHGTTLSDETVRDIRARVGLVFQDPDDQLFMTTVYDDVAFGALNMGLSRDEVDQRVHDALHAVGLADTASRPGQHLSFGQKKRIALATVLAMTPDVLVLDEPTSNLDPRAKRTMVSLLESLDTTLVVATHDMELAWHLCTRAVVVDGGRIVADGPADEIMTDETLMERHGLELPPSVRAAQRAR